MASESVLKSFLIKLGFRVDQQQFKNFQGSLEATGKNAIEMSKSVLKAGAAIGASMTGVYAVTALTTKSMDGLYWSSKRIGTTVGDLESVKRAAEAIGVSADTMAGTLESIAQKRRTQPWINQMFGFDPKNPSSLAAFKKFIDDARRDEARFAPGSTLGIAAHNKWAMRGQQLGIDEETLYQAEKNGPEFDKNFASYQQQQKAGHVDLDKISRDSHQATVDNEHTAAAIEDVHRMTADRLIPAMEAANSAARKLAVTYGVADAATGGMSSVLMGLSPIAITAGVSVLALAAKIRILGDAANTTVPGGGSAGTGAAAATEAEGAGTDVLAAAGFGGGETAGTAVAAGETLGAGAAIAGGAEAGAAGGSIIPGAGTIVGAIAGAAVAGVGALLWHHHEAAKAAEAQKAASESSKKPATSPIPGSITDLSGYDVTANDVTVRGSSVTVIGSGVGEGDSSAYHPTSFDTSSTTDSGIFRNADPSLDAGTVNHTASFIAGWEGHAKSGYGEYRDAGGTLTAGIGHQVLPGEDLSGLDRNGAMALFARDLKPSLDAIHQLVHVRLNQNQTTALADLEFNIGKGAFTHSTLLRELNAGNYASADRHFEDWNKVHHQYSQGLQNRRIADESLFGRGGSGGDSGPSNNVTIHQKTDIHVTGGDPVATGKEVALQQRRVHGDIVRNMSGAIA